MDQQNTIDTEDLESKVPRLRYIVACEEGPFSGQSIVSGGHVCINGQSATLGGCTLEITVPDGSEVDLMLAKNRHDLRWIFSVFLDTLDGDNHLLAMVFVDELSSDCLERASTPDGSVTWYLSSDLGLAENFEEVAEKSGGCVKLIGDIRSCFKDSGPAQAEPSKTQ